uniref:Uncharacterized protein n=1 Tax=Fundulus heteroclitus TaxID=8078 RepID=A0A3Q2PJS6_FUNHE
ITAAEQERSRNKHQGMKVDINHKTKAKDLLKILAEGVERVSLSTVKLQHKQNRLEFANELRDNDLTYWRHVL